MTKLEEKLKQLGYTKSEDTKYEYYRFVKSYAININISNKHNIEGYVSVERCIYDDICINNIQQAYNEMQKDLEVLRQCYE